MAFITGVATSTEFDLYQTSTAVPSALGMGQRVFGTGGRIYRLALVGAVTLVAGNLLQESANDTTYTNMAIGTAAAVGDTSLQVTNGTATITNEQYQGGSVSVYTAGTVPVGDEYVITGVSGTLTTGGALTVNVDRPLRYAFTTAAKVTMKRSVWSGVVQFPVTTQTGMPAGVAINAAANATYTWVLTHGEAAVLSDNSTFAVGSQLSPSLAVAGAAGVNVAGTTHGVIGWARQAAASTKAISAFIQID